MPETTTRLPPADRAQRRADIRRMLVKSGGDVEAVLLAFGITRNVLYNAAGECGISVKGLRRAAKLRRDNSMGYSAGEGR